MMMTTTRRRMTMRTMKRMRTMRRMRTTRTTRRTRRRNIPACQVSDDYYIVVVHTTGDNKDGSNQVTYAKKTKQLQSGTEMVKGQVFGHETFLFADWVTRSHSCWSPKQCLFREAFLKKPVKFGNLSQQSGWVSTLIPIS